MNTINHYTFFTLEGRAPLIQTIKEIETMADLPANHLAGRAYFGIISLSKKKINAKVDF